MKKRIWITGASSGIGKAVAIRLAAAGHTLIISGRNQPLLNELAEQIKATVIAFEATDKQANLHAAETIKNKFGGLDIAFLNAGICEYVDIKNFDSELFSRVLNNNFMSMVYGIEASLPLLRASLNPHLVGMSSTIGYLGLPRAAAYGASKAAVYNMLQGLRLDLKPENIPVSIVCPGFVKTPLTEQNTFNMPGMISVEKAAQHIVNGINKQTEEIKFPFAFAMALKFLSVLPSKLCTLVTYHLTKNS